MHCISDSMNNIKINVNTLFSKANTMNLDDLNDGFKAIMKQGDKDLDESGNFYFVVSILIIKF